MNRVSVAVFALALAAGPAAAQTPPCGTTVTTDLTLTADMSCAGTALWVGADGITIDLAGFTLTGNGATVGAAGVANIGYNETTNGNGTITGFFFGIHLEDADRNTIQDVTADANWFSGIYVEAGSDGNRIADCVVTNNGTPARRGNGITINGSSGNLVTRTFASGNQTQGIFVGGGADTTASSSTRLLRNVSQNNVSNGIGIIGGSKHLVAGNITTGNGAHGISLSSLPVPGSVTDSALIGNETAGNTLNGIALNAAHGNHLAANRISGNVLTGMLFTDSDSNIVTGNRADDNTVHGVLVRSGSDRNQFRGNRLESNGVRGIVVTSGGGPAPSGNRFTGNGASSNGAGDVLDQTVGGGTDGTDSLYRGMRCETSIPAGICGP